MRAASCEARPVLTALDPVLLARVLTRALRRGGDFADVFFENKLSQTFRLQDGRIHEATTSVVRGAGVRVVVGQRAGYAYSDDLDEAALLRAAEAASLIARDGREQEVAVALAPSAAPQLYAPHADEPARLGPLRRPAWPGPTPPRAASTRASARSTPS